MDSLPKNSDIMPTDISSLINSFFEEEQIQNEYSSKPSLVNRYKLKIKDYFRVWEWGRIRYASLAILDISLILLILLNALGPAQKMIAPFINSEPEKLESLKNSKSGYEVFGFAPYWTFNKLDNIDFSTLTTFSYFGVEVEADGNLDKEGQGYQTFTSQKATDIFKKAHSNGTRVVLTLTQMKNGPIRTLMDDPAAQQNAIDQAVTEVKNRGIDGINVDLEYTGNPGQEYRDKFSTFVKNLTQKMHQEVPSSRVTVSVYASAIKEPKIYDIKSLGQNSDGIFMMAYDFAVAGSDNAIPTAPLYGHKEGKYWFDVSTAVEQFLTQMPANKLILGVPWYGYNYAVKGEPQVKAATNKGYYTYYKRGRRTYSYFTPIKGRAQTYAIVQNEVTESNTDSFKTGWDDYGKVSWRAYNVDGVWRMVFIDDPKSLAIKYDFAKDKKLGGVGMWALGFDDGKSDMWALLKDKFGEKDLADNAFINKEIR